MRIRPAVDCFISSAGHSPYCSFRFHGRSLLPFLATPLGGQSPPRRCDPRFSLLGGGAQWCRQYLCLPEAKMPFIPMKPSRSTPPPPSIEGFWCRTPFVKPAWLSRFFFGLPSIEFSFDVYFGHCPLPYHSLHLFAPLFFPPFFSPTLPFPSFFFDPRPPSPLALSVFCDFK